MTKEDINIIKSILRTQRFSSLIFQNGFDSDDLLQDVCIKLLMNPYNPNKETKKYSWYYFAVNSVVMDATRQHLRRSDLYSDNKSTIQSNNHGESSERSIYLKGEQELLDALESLPIEEVEALLADMTGE